MTDSKTAKKIEIRQCPAHKDRFALTVNGVWYIDPNTFGMANFCVGTEAEAQQKAAELAATELVEPASRPLDELEKLAVEAEANPGVRYSHDWHMATEPEKVLALLAENRKLRSRLDSYRGSTTESLHRKIETLAAASSPVARPQCDAVSVESGLRCQLETHSTRIAHQPAARVEQPTPYKFIRFERDKNNGANLHAVFFGDRALHHFKATDNVEAYMADIQRNLEAYVELIAAPAAPVVEQRPKLTIWAFLATRNNLSHEQREVIEKFLKRYEEFERTEGEGQHGKD